MAADLAAGYCGEPTVEDFLKRVGEEYPNPRVKEGRRQLWLIDDLDNAIAPRHLPILAKYWLGREDSNLRMVESKSTALPLGDAPICCLESGGPGLPRIPSGNAGL
jgi:hypothetical protein